MTQTFDNNFSPLAFYGDEALQYHRRSYSYGQIWPLRVPSYKIPPFQIRRAQRASGISVAWLYDTGGNAVKQLPSLAPAVKKYPFDGYDVLVFDGVQSFMDLPVGSYYLVLSDGAETFYSDVFSTGCTWFAKIEWWDDDDMELDGNTVVFQDGYRQTLYFPTTIGNPEYQTEEVGEDRDGFYFPEYKISWKEFHCEFTALEYMADCLSRADQSDHLVITDQFGRNYMVDKLEMETEWIGRGKANISLSFTTDTVYKKLSKGVYTVSAERDYNSDFNEDFK